MKNKMVSLVILVSFFLLFFGSANLWAEEEIPTTSTDVSILSNYIWRGQQLSHDSVVIQPSMTVSYMGFSGNLWGNLDTDQSNSDENQNWNETDLTLSYSKGFDMLSVEGGYIYYSLDECDDTQELFLTLGLDTLLSPSLTVYKDIDACPSWYFLLGISHGFEITERVSLELSGSISYLLSDSDNDYPEIGSDDEPTGDKFKDFHDGVISANLPITITKYITIIPSLSYTFPLSSNASDEMEWRSQKGDDDNFLYGGVTLSISF